MPDVVSGSETLSKRVSAAMALVWKDYVSQRPEVTTQISGTRVACVLTDSATSFDTRLTSELLNEDGEPLPARTLTQYRREAIGAVAKTTHQRVSAFISKHDKKTDVVTEVFILDGPPMEGPGTPIHTPRT